MSLKLIVEVDGKEHRTAEGRARDEARDKLLQSLGYKVVRIEGFRVTQDPLEIRALLEHYVDKRLTEQKSSAREADPANSP